MERFRKQVALVFPSGSLQISAQDQLARVAAMRELGLGVHEMPVFHQSSDKTSAATAVERAAMISHALTRRMYDVVWAARGGYGATSLVPLLRNMLPPVLPPKVLVGFSDVSFLGVTLALQYPTLTYIHGRNFFSEDLLNGDESEQKTLFDIVLGNSVPPAFFEAQCATAGFESRLTGLCIPMNMSLAESLATLRDAKLPEGSVLFLEDCNEYTYRVLRKFDSLINSGILKNVSAIVVGNFSRCEKPDGTLASDFEIAGYFAERVKIPVFSLPIFGHAVKKFPLVAMSRVEFECKHSAWKIKLSFERAHHQEVCKIYDSEIPGEDERIHFTGVGGTGMASVAGLFRSGRFALTGSDTPIFPPMDKVIAEMGIEFCENYKAENVDKCKPDVVVLSNVISRKNAALQGNPELERILELNVPMLSFPSALRKFFLKRSKNIVVTGTHGKTTTTSLIAQTLRSMRLNPSLFVGGAPKNFVSGYHLGSRDLFVLEGDEYDTAYFDKGPKYMHYEPTVALLNNIEFDHADIYNDVEAIEREFERLSRYTRERGGIAVANLLESRVVKVARASGATVMAFGDANSNRENCVFGHGEAPMWKLISFVTRTSGMILNVQAPWGEEIGIQTQIFGRHNALNAVGALASIHSYFLLKWRGFSAFSQAEFFDAASKPIPKDVLAELVAGIGSFEGVKRRFEFVGEGDGVVVFDDFAHHPTAIHTTLDAFRSYMHAAGRQGRLLACFDPRNATMRRRVLQDEVARSFALADKVFLGKVPQDLRIAEDERLDGPGLAKTIGAKAVYFDDNDALLKGVLEEIQSGDTLVFMGPSGAFTGFPQKVVQERRRG